MVPGAKPAPPRVPKGAKHAIRKLGNVWAVSPGSGVRSAKTLVTRPVLEAVVRRKMVTASPAFTVPGGTPATRLVQAIAPNATNGQVTAVSAKMAGMERTAKINALKLV